MHGATSVRPIATRAGGWITIIATLLFTVSANAVQAPAKTPSKTTQGQTVPRSASSANKKPDTAKSDDLAWLQEALKNPDLMSEVNHLSERLGKELQYPSLRTQSALLPRLPQNTVFYVALPNFGQQLRQALEIYREELHDSAPLRDFLQKNHLSASEPKVEDGIAKFGELLDYLGDELVVTGGLKGKDPNGVLIAEIKKPGLKAFLEKLDLELNGTSSDHIRVFDPQQLETATDKPGQEPVVLIRSDFVVISTSAATLRDFNTQLDKGSSSFASSQLGKRLTQSYQSGTSTVAGLDIQRLMDLVPENSPQAKAMLEKTGFADAKYAVMEGRLSSGKANTQMELAFNGTRHGVASWITAPGQLGALDFMSPKSYVGEVFRLKNPAQMFDDIADIAGPGAMAMLPQMEAQLNVNLKRDILSKLTGEIGFEMQEPMIPPPGSARGTPPPQPNFTFVVGISDPAGVQQSFKRLLAQAPMQSDERQEEGVTIYTLTSPSSNGQATELNYFFMDGYLVIGTNRTQAEEALRVHRNGESLAKSNQIANAAGQAVKASALVYQNAGPMIATILKQLPGDLTSQLPRNLLAGEVTGNVVVVTADDNTIRASAGNSVTADAGVAMLVAAIAIPNLLRAKTSANEAAAMATVRTINTAEVTYMTAYPKKGYAATLAVMGPGTTGDCTGSNVNPSHACLLDDTVGNISCVAGKWCEKNAYRYSVRGVCPQTSCNGYVVTASPVNESSGTKSFCSVKDAVVRSHSGPVTTPLTPAECRAWEPVN